MTVSATVTVSDIATLTADAADRLTGRPVPSRDDIVALLTATLISRDGTVRLRSRPARVADTLRADSAALLAALRFHTGSNVNLHGPIMHSFTVGRDRYDQLDTLAHIVAILLRGRSVGHAVWHNALTGGA